MLTNFEIGPAMWQGFSLYGACLHLIVIPVGMGNKIGLTFHNLGKQKTGDNNSEFLKMGTKIANALNQETKSAIKLNKKHAYTSK